MLGDYRGSASIFVNLEVELLAATALPTAETNVVALAARRYIAPHLFALLNFTVSMWMTQFRRPRPGLQPAGAGSSGDPF